MRDSAQVLFKKLPCCKPSQKVKKTRNGVAHNRKTSRMASLNNKQTAGYVILNSPARSVDFYNMNVTSPLSFSSHFSNQVKWFEPFSLSSLNSIHFLFCCNLAIFSLFFQFHLQPPSRDRSFPYIYHVPFRRRSSKFGLHHDTRLFFQPSAHPLPPAVGLIYN